MIVFPQGGVLKMSKGVSAGQVMVLTNLKSRQDSICRVLKVRAYAKAQSYVEVEFTSPQPGYWGVYFPTDGPEVARTAQPQPAAPERRSVAPVAASTIQKSPEAAEVKAPEASWAPAAPPVIEEQQPVIHAEAPQPAVVHPPRPLAPAKLPESSFVSIGAKEEVLAAADATRAPRASTFTNGSVKQPLGGDSDISDAIDALIIPSARAASAAAPSMHSTASELTRGNAAHEAHELALGHAKPSAPHEAAAETGLPLPKQMFGVALDSATSLADLSSRGSGGRMWIPIGVAALLAVGAAGAYYFHFRPSAGAAAAAPAAQVSATQTPSSEPGVSTAPEQPVDGDTHQIPDQAAAEPLPGVSQSGDAKIDPSSASAAYASEASIRSREPFSPRRAAASPESKPAATKPNVVIPSASGTLNMRPVVRKGAGAYSAGAAPAVDAGGSLSGPGASLVAITPPPSLAEPPKPGPVSTAPVRVGGKILPPRLVSSVLPVYPPIAQQAGVRGTVIIDTIIGKDGNVSKMRVISGPELLRSAALGALRQWKYEPSKLDGQIISVEMIVSIQFH